MFELWRTKRRLQKLARARDRDYAKEKANLRKEEDYYSWWAQWEVDIIDVREDYEIIRTSHWIRKAVDSLVEVPPHGGRDGYWEETQNTGQSVLTDQGVAYIRSAVRQEKLASTELTLRRVYLPVAVLAAAGSAVAIFKDC